ncbi:DUF6090 family protein [Winogradskyella sp. MIT101101]|uniref:DUF6090 family protein n=1 Tax=Winogradskyella sp. MIT101101 TaxID=3098297 RepID=UPI00399BCAD9
MIKFFRNIRQKLLTENKISKYLLYAIGEIVLVVIGILIALSINNWNETEKQNVKNRNLIVRLKNQISQNIDITKGEVESSKLQTKRMGALISMLGETLGDSNKIKADSLIFYSTKDYYIILDMNTINEALDNGEISLIENDSLKLMIYKLLSFVDLIKERESIANEDNNNFLVPYIYKNVNKRSNKSNLLENYRKQIGHSKLEENNYRDIAMDLEFENLIDSRLLYAIELSLLYQELNRILEKTKEILDKEK